MPLTLDNTRWKSHPISIYAGFRCEECGTLIYASQFKLCKCDTDTQCIIAGPKENDEQLWWNTERGWIEDMTEATTFPPSVIDYPLPTGATGVLELTLTGEHVRFLKTLPV